jgi:hypothetical protein
METGMRLNLRVALVGLVTSFASIAGLSQAATLTFDNPTIGPNYTEAGLTISRTVASDFDVNTFGGAWGLPCCSGGFAQYSLTTGGLFNFDQITVNHSDAGNPVVFEGFLNGLSIASYILDASNFGASILSFVGFAGLDTLQVSMSGNFNDPRFDNLVFTDAGMPVSPVPLPAALPLLLAALGALGISKVSRRQKLA